jgi:hypothetical protein
MKTEQRLPLWVWVAGPVVVVIAAVVLLALLREQETDELPAAGVTLEEVSEEPSRFFGETVTVRGDVTQVLGARSFLITQRLDSDLLVVSSVPLREVGDESGGATFSEESQVWVTGEVRWCEPHFPDSARSQLPAFRAFSASNSTGGRYPRLECNLFSL